MGDLRATGPRPSKAFAGVLHERVGPPMRCGPAHGPSSPPMLQEARPSHDPRPRTHDRGVDERPGDKVDPLDPSCRRVAQLAPPLGVVPPIDVTVASELASANEAVAPRARVSMEELVPQLVKRIAWAGDRRRGSVQLELGAGPHAGTTITVHSDEGRVRVELDASGADEFRARIDARLRRLGLDVESVT